jgi:hypothetical protein
MSSRTQTLLLFFLSIFSLALSTQADYLVINGDFEGGIYTGRGGQTLPLQWDAYWNRLDGWGSPGVAHWSTDGSNGYVVTDVDGTTGGGGYAVAFEAPTGRAGEELSVWGIPVGTTVRLSADIIDLIPGGGGGGAILKMEAWEYGATASFNALEVPISGVTGDWKRFSMNYTIPNDTDMLKAVVGTSTGWGGANPYPSSYGFDNVKLGLLRPAALFPTPNVGQAVPPAFDELRWTNPEPNLPGHIITCDVWFRQSPTPLAEPNLVAGQPGVIQIASQEAIDSLSLSSCGITLQDDYYYYWKVDCLDPSAGKLEGFTWSFNTGDRLPVPDAGTDQYLWITMDDGTPNDGKVTFTLSGSVIDDGKSPLTTTWSLDRILTQTDPATQVIIDHPNNLTTTVTIDNTGWFFFRLTAADAAGSNDDLVNVGVYATACEAAYEDPQDVSVRYENTPHGDINRDCEINLEDLAIIAATWLDCMSSKLNCIP